MDRKSFMAELEAALTGRMSDGEMREVLSDYDEFFASGLAEGSAEEDVAARLGDPAKIALSLLESRLGQSGSTANASRRPLIHKAPIYRRLLAVAGDALLAALPFIAVATKLALIGFFVPQYIPGVLASFFGTVRISNHIWISFARPLWLLAIVLSGFWYYLFNPLCMVVMRGQTVGKRLLGLRVVAAGGKPANPGQYIVRELFGKFGLNMVCSLIWLPLAFLPALASLIWAIVSPEGLTVWDAIAGTRVIEVSPRREGV